MTRPPRTPLPVLRRSGGRGFGTPVRGTPSCCTALAWPAQPSSGKAWSSQHLVPAEASGPVGPPRRDLVKGGEDLTPAPRRGRNPHTVPKELGSLHSCARPQGTELIFLPVLGWCKPDTRYRALSLSGPGFPSLPEAPRRWRRSGADGMSTARRASEVLLLLPSVSAAHAGTTGVAPGPLFFRGSC